MYGESKFISNQRIVFFTVPHIISSHRTARESTGFPGLSQKCAKLRLRNKHCCRAPPPTPTTRKLVKDQLRSEDVKMLLYLTLHLNKQSFLQSLENLLSAQHCGVALIIRCIKLSNYIYTHTFFSS